MKNLSRKVRFLNFFRRIFQVGFLEEWLARHTEGKSPDHFVSKFVPNAYQYARPSMRTFSRDGIKLKVDISDYIGHYYYFGFDDASHRQLFNLCSPDANVIDVGANLGFTALRMAQIARKGHVIAFEPDPFNYSSCLENLALNNLSNVRVVNVGLGHERGLLQMELRTSANRGGNRINNQAVNGYEVQVNRLDGVLSDLKFKRVDLIKIDVEGYELKVLTGAKETINRHKPVLFVEVDDNNLRDQGDSAKALLDFLKQAGYDNIIRADTRQVITPITDFSNCHFDIIVR